MTNVEELVQQAMPSIVEGMKAEIKQSITWQVKEDAAKLVSAHVQEWIKAHVLPEITEALIESKEGLVTLGAELAPAMVKGLTDAMTVEFTKKLANSWERSKVFEACFK